MTHRRLHAPLLVSALFAAFVLRVVFLTSESLWRDEVDAIRFAFLPLTESLANFSSVGFNGPFYHLLLRGWLLLTGVHDFGLRYFSGVCGLLVVALSYALAARLFGRRVGLITAWLCALSPILIWYAGEGKMYSLQPALLTLALYSVARGMTGATHTRRWWVTCVAATSLGFYTHLLSPVFLAVLAAFVAGLWQRHLPRTKHVLIALACLTVPYLPLAGWQIGAFLNAGSSSIFPFYPLPVIVQTLALNWSLGLDGASLLLQPLGTAGNSIRWLMVAGVFGLALLGVGRRSWIMLAWLVLPALLIFIVTLRYPLFQPRYVLYSVPALWMLVALGLTRLPAQLARAAMAFVVFVALTGVAGQWLNPIRPNLRAAVASINTQAQPGDALIYQIGYTRYAFEYYGIRSDVVTFDGPSTNGVAEDDAYASIFATAEPHTRVWLVEVEPELWDTRRLTRRWFDENWRMLERHDVHGVEIGLYAPLD
jgi:mannosyltransferase